MRRAGNPDRVLATVLFTDIVGSTEVAARLGDRQWRAHVARHHAIVRTNLKRSRGREIDTAGDGFFAIFDHPAQAIDCATNIIAALRPLGLEIRAGIHTGEVEQTGRSVGGIAVHIGARVMATAGPSEVVVTGTVKDLVTGSGVGFVDRGMTTLKGIDGEWRLHAVEAQPRDRVDLPEPSAAEQPARSSRLWVVFGLVGIGALGLALAVLLLPRALAGPVVPGLNSVGHIPQGGREFDVAVGVGQQPSGLAVGEDAIWAINFADQTLSRIDPAEGRVGANPAIPGSPSGIAYGAGGIWVTTHFGLAAGDVGSVVRFDSRPVKGPTIPVSNGVEAIAYGEGWIWVADRIADVVRRIDPGTNRLVPEAIPVGRAPGAIAVGAGSVWVTSTLDDTLWRIDPATSSVVDTIALRGPASAIAVTPAAVWVASEAGDWVARIDPTTNLQVSSVEGLDGPRGLAATDDAVWVAVGREARVVRIDPATNQVAQGYDVAGLPDALATDAAGGVWVAVRAP